MCTKGRGVNRKKNPYIKKLLFVKDSFAYLGNNFRKGLEYEMYEKAFSSTQLISMVFYSSSL